MTSRSYKYRYAKARFIAFLAYFIDTALFWITLGFIIGTIACTYSLTVAFTELDKVIVCKP